MASVYFLEKFYLKVMFSVIYINVIIHTVYITVKPFEAIEDWFYRYTTLAFDPDRVLANYNSSTVEGFSLTQRPKRWI